MSIRKSFLNTFVDNYTMNETLELIEKSINENKKIRHVVINAGKIVNLQSNLELQESVNNCDLINADGQAVVWASKILNKPLKERVAGIDLMQNLVELAHKKIIKFFFLEQKKRL